MRVTVEVPDQQPQQGPSIEGMLERLHTAAREACRAEQAMEHLLRADALVQNLRKCARLAQVAELATEIEGRIGMASAILCGATIGGDLRNAVDRVQGMEMRPLTAEETKYAPSAVFGRTKKT